MTPTGFELIATTTSQHNELGNPPPAGAAQSGAVTSGVLPPDRDLARVVAAWPDLEQHIRAAVLALVGAAGA
jgi:hypothetical protein